MVTQRQSVFYSGSLPLLTYYLHQLAGHVDDVDDRDPQKKTLLVFGTIQLTFEAPVVTLEVCIIA